MCPDLRRMLASLQNALTHVAAEVAYPGEEASDVNLSIWGLVDTNPTTRRWEQSVDQFCRSRRFTWHVRQSTLERARTSKSS
jgi:hypothetical protein